MTIDLPKIGKPATNALHHIGVKTLEDVAGYDRTTLLAIHGVGPKAMDILEDNLKKHNMNFKEDIGFDLGLKAVTTMAPATSRENSHS